MGEVRPPPTLPLDLPMLSIEMSWLGNFYFEYTHYIFIKSSLCYIILTRCQLARFVIIIPSTSMVLTHPLFSTRLIKLLQSTIYIYISFPLYQMPLPTAVKPVLSGHSKRRPKLVFKTDYCFMQVNSIAECSNGSILKYFWPSLSYHLSLRPSFCLFWVAA